jgi:four helix bundle protein
MPAAPDLVVFNKAHDLVLAIYRVTKSFPWNEELGLTAQLRRAAASIPSNIVEGRAKSSPKELRRHLDIAHGSVAEVEYQLRLARDLGYVSDDDWQLCDAAAQEISRMLSTFKRTVERQTRRMP